MLQPKEKAQELISKFISIELSQLSDLVDGIRIRLAKESCYILIDEVIKELTQECEDTQALLYWQEVYCEVGLF